MIRTMIEEHAREAAELSALRAGFLMAPDRSLRDLCALDERIEAHLDGLRIGGRGAARLCERATDLGGPEELFVSATLAFESRDRARIGFVVDAACADPMLRRAAATSLTWLARAEAEPIVLELSRSAIAALRWLALSAAAAHRLELPGTIEGALADEDPSLRARALQAVGELMLRARVPELLVGLEADEPACRFAAASSAALLGASTSAAPVLRELARLDEPFAESACRFAAGAMAVEETRAWVHRLRSDGRTRLAAIAAGAAGDAMLVPALLDWATEASVARVCAEAITSITGIEIAGDLAIVPSAAEHAGIEERGDEVLDDPDAGLAWPNLPALAKAGERVPHVEGERMLLGRALEPRWLIEVLRHGRQRHRREAARCLATSGDPHPLFETRARGERQLRALAAMGAP